MAISHYLNNISNPPSQFYESRFFTEIASDWTYTFGKYCVSKRLMPITQIPYVIRYSVEVGVGHAFLGANVWSQYENE